MGQIRLDRLRRVPRRRRAPSTTPPRSPASPPDAPTFPSAYRLKDPRWWIPERRWSNGRTETHSPTATRPAAPRPPTRRSRLRPSRQHRRTAHDLRQARVSVQGRPARSSTAPTSNGPAKSATKPSPNCSAQNSATATSRGSTTPAGSENSSPNSKPSHSTRSRTPRTGTPTSSIGLAAGDEGVNDTLQRTRPRRTLPCPAATSTTPSNALEVTGVRSVRSLPRRCSDTMTGRPRQAEPVRGHPGLTSSWTSVQLVGEAGIAAVSFPTTFE